MRKPTQTVAAIGTLVLATLLAGCLGGGEGGAFTDQFHLDDCEFASTGSNRFFILEPGYRLVLEGTEDGEPVSVTVTVLDETRVVDDVETRVVEERETEGGELVEVSRNYFALCTRTGGVFYFGEEVDDYEDNQVVGHGGAWLAGQDGARAGLIMPGEPLLGARYYQEVAPGVALDRAEVISLDGTIDTPAGSFTGVLRTRETSAVETDALEYKDYAPGVGLVREEGLRLTAYGFVGG